MIFSYTGRILCKRAWSHLHGNISQNCSKCWRGLFPMCIWYNFFDIAVFILQWWVLFCVRHSLTRPKKFTRKSRRGCLTSTMRYLPILGIFSIASSHVMFFCIFRLMVSNWAHNMPPQVRPCQQVAVGPMMAEVAARLIHLYQTFRG